MSALDTIDEMIAEVEAILVKPESECLVPHDITQAILDDLTESRSRLVSWMRWAE